ncbi:MAG TPA: PEGA domain-containing protein [Bryobacteraceae bacterium]|nr:PEGA domain-containing protein [Bryobacteraceae bacterium]
MNPAQRTAHFDELNRLDAEIRRAGDVYTLRPIHDRLEELSRLYASDAAMMNAIGSVKATMVAHGQRLMSNSGQTPTPGPLQPPPAAGSLPTQVMPTSGVSVPPSAGPATGPGPRIPSGPQQVVSPAGQPPAKPAAAFNWKRAAAVGGVIGLLVAAGGIYTIQNARKAKDIGATAGNVRVAVKTNPPGASIRVNGEVKCTSDCNIELAPGPYEVQAVLPGYETATSKLELSATAPGNVDLTLQPLPLSVRLYTDFTTGKVTFDGAPYGDLQDGQLILDRISAGKHTIKVNSQANEAQFEFEAQPGRQPVVIGPVTARNTLAILVANAGQQTRIHSSIPALKVAIDGNMAGDATPTGLDVNNLQPGDREFSVDDGGTKRNLLVSVSAQPTLTAYLKLDINAGSLLISTPGEEGVSAFLNDRPARIKSKAGQMRLPGIPVGTYMVRVAKDGYAQEAPQKVVIAKGQEARVEFKLKIVPKVATLRLRGVVTGTQVYLDGNAIGAVPASGQFEFAQVAPGEHVVELRRDRMAPKRNPRQFRAGETIELSGADVTLSAAAATLRLNVSPASAQVTIKGPNDAAPRTISGNSLQLSEGTYVVTAKAPNYADRTQTVVLASGETKSVDLALTEQKQSAKQNTPQRRTGGMADWDDPGAWIPEGGWYKRKGGGVVSYGIAPTQGTFSFNISRIDGRRLQWAVDIQDAKNYVQFQLEKKNFIRREIINGKDRNEFKVEHKLPDTKNYSVQVEITPNTVKTFILDGTEWRTIDSWSTNSRTLTQGKFGLIIPGGDVFGLTNFRFIPK